MTSTDSISIDSNARQQVFTLMLDGGTTYSDITEVLDITRSTARDHVRGLRNKDGVPVGEREKGGEKHFYYRPAMKEHPTNPSEDTSELRSKASVTKEAKEQVHELIQHLDKDLNGRAPANAPLSVRESHEDVVVHRSDDHIGAAYEDEFGNKTFSAEIAVERVREITNRVFQLKRRQEAAGVDFDTLHILMGGDHVHGAGIHDDQPWETDLSVPEQIHTASDIYMEFIDRAVDEFETVQVVCQKGNHGELRGDGYGPDDNVDTAFFMSLDRRVRDRDYDNVRFIRSSGGHFTNFPIRGETLNDCEWRGHLRHGQQSLEHIGTSAGKKRWLQWLHQHEFDIAYRGHYHSFRIEEISSRPVIESGAIVPPSDYEESMAEWSKPAATIHGVSDDRTMTWFYPVEFSG